MAAASNRVVVNCAPRLFRREGAAAYLGISPNHLDKLVKTGVVPPPKLLQGDKKWDRSDLDALVDGLPTEADLIEDASWDE